MESTASMAVVARGFVSAPALSCHKVQNEGKKMSHDGKCPDMYECRLGVNKILRENVRLKLAQKKSLKLTPKEKDYIWKMCAYFIDGARVEREGLRAVKIIQKKMEE